MRRMFVIDTDNLEYEHVITLLRELPQTWYPACLIELVKASYAHGVFNPGGASTIARKTEAKMDKHADDDSLSIRENQLGNAVKLIERLCRQADKDNPTRKQALGWLSREGLLGSPLRCTEAKP